jgi:hypothetical protein
MQCIDFKRMHMYFVGETTEPHVLVSTVCRNVGQIRLWPVTTARWDESRDVSDMMIWYDIFILHDIPWDLHFNINDHYISDHFMIWELQTRSSQYWSSTHPDIDGWWSLLNWRILWRIVIVTAFWCLDRLLDTNENITETSVSLFVEDALHFSSLASCFAKVAWWSSELT